ncbi:MAG: CADD family putative folate metabolism protein [Chloroflexi bacterium]|nr:CADD family putative folate metabolism protein [Chloroflexota bacterium]
MVATTDIVEEIRQITEERSLLKHPFYRAWQEGSLTLDALRGYAGQYWPHVLAFPQYVSAAHAVCPQEAVSDRQELLENLIEEERGPENHPELWLRFAEGVGATRQDVRAAMPLPETDRLVATFRDATMKRSFAEACAALYVYESQVPEVAKTKIAGLKEFYGIDAPSALQFFEVHIGADEIHSEVGAGMVRRHTRTEGDREAVLGTARECADALWSFLDGCEREFVPRTQNREPGT